MEEPRLYTGKIKVEYEASANMYARSFEDAYDELQKAIQVYLSELNATNAHGYIISVELTPRLYDHLIICSNDRHLPPEQCPMCKKFIVDGKLDYGKAYGEGKK